MIPSKKVGIFHNGRPKNVGWLQVNSDGTWTQESLPRLRAWQCWEHKCKSGSDQTGLQQLEGSTKSVEEESVCLWISSHEKHIWYVFSRNNPASKLESGTEVGGGHRMVTNIFNQICHTADEK